MPVRGNWESAWRSVGPDVLTVILAAQEAAAASAVGYVGDITAELGVGSKPTGILNVDAFVGVAGDGRPVESLTYGAVVQAAQAQYSPAATGLSSNRAAIFGLHSGSDWLSTVAASVVADTARASEAASSARHHVHGYVRMVSPNACSRCVILAGKFYRYNEGFQRHPKCQCRHIPASENIAGDVMTNPTSYFDALPKSEQDRVFTSAGAEAIRLGADPTQVVNARRGMRTAQVYGRKALVTTEGATARGLAGKSLGDLSKVAGQRYRVSKTPRLMPETILAHATSPEDALRLLKRFGYVL